MSPSPPMQPPPFKQLEQFVRRDDGNYVLLFEGTDGRKYRAELTADAAGQTIEALQRLPTKRPNQELLTLTLTGIHTGLNADGRGAIVFHTKEHGRIAFVPPDAQAIADIRRHLAELELALIPQARQ